jgi:hypothetical protein
VDDMTTNHRWVATGDSARRAAAEFPKVLVRQRWWWGLVALVQVAYAGLFVLALDDQDSLAYRALWAVVFALVPTILIVMLVLGLSCVVNRRRFRQRMREGVVLEASIGERALNLRSPWAEHVLSFDGLSKVVSSGDWVFVKQKGVPLWGVWPAELFPPDDLARLQRSIARSEP